MKNKIIVLITAFFILSCVLSCENPVLEKWWQVDEEAPVDYIYITKHIPIINYETIYETIIEEKIIYEQLPPEIIYEITEVEVIKEIEKIIYETIYVEKEVEVIKEVIKEIIKEVIIYETEEVEIEIIKEVIIEVVKEIIVEKPVYIYQIIYEEVEVIKEVEVEVIKEVPGPPTEEIIIEWIKENPDKVVEIIIKEKEIIKEIFHQLPPEEILIYLTEEQLIYIIETLTEEQIKYIIEQLPPEIIIEYLTEEQIEYIIKNAPREKILQSIIPVNIEYILFSGDQHLYNAPHGPNANSSVSAEQIAFNNNTVATMARFFVDEPTYLLMLHGHANPTYFTEEEKIELTWLSLTRADQVLRVFVKEFIKYNKILGDTYYAGYAADDSLFQGLPVYPVDYTDPNYEDDLKNYREELNKLLIELKLDKRLTTSGYGGGKTIMGSNPAYEGLNRRVEMILFEIETTHIIEEP